MRRLHARFAGTDHQADTYFRVPSGRLKVREGKIEKALIFYHRENAQRARRSDVLVMPLPPRNSLRQVLAAAFGVLTVVKKRREIFFIGNVKIHLDRVPGLGRFVEVEAIGKPRVHGQRPNVERLRKQARRFQELFGVGPSDIVPESYSDLVRRKQNRRVRA